MGNSEKGPSEHLNGQKESRDARQVILGRIETKKLLISPRKEDPTETLRYNGQIVCSTMKPSEEAKAEEDIRDGRWVPGVLRGWPKRDSKDPPKWASRPEKVMRRGKKEEPEEENKAAGIFDDVDDPGPPPEPVEKMREKLGKKKLPPVDRKAKETRNEVLGGMFDDLDDAPPETMEELAEKPVPEDADTPDWARRPEKVMRRGKKEEPEEENKD